MTRARAREDATRNDDAQAVVLVVDADEVDRMAVVRALRAAALPIRAVEAATAAEAKALISDSKPDCVVFDHRSPDAFEHTVRSLLGIDSADVAVVVLTGLWDERVAAQLENEGVWDYLSKDTFEPGSFARVVVRAIRTHRAESELSRLEAQQRRQAAMLSQLSNVSTELYAALTLEDMVDRAAESVRALFDSHRGYVFVHPGLDGAERGAFALLDADADSTSELLGEAWHSLQDVPEALCLNGPPLGNRAVQRLLAPIRSRDRSVIGIVAVDVVADKRGDREMDRTILALFSHLVSLAVESARFIPEDKTTVAREARLRTA